MGLSTREVADQEGVNQSSVVRICKIFNETGNFDDRPKSDRPKSLSERYERKLLPQSSEPGIELQCALVEM
ncbi:11579_t:CDS:2 [Funneliformis caledonium]|uniref:11579_t:CDS:1 n=1 Tax=Funneliformis caledonium TaxID=1117310 RepID=A0A9N9H4U0_9GLOM|nr:11579_t:CDS:2 [Funneliformis caledonium]